MEGAREPEAFLVKVAVGLSGYPALLRLQPRRAPKLLQVHLSPSPRAPWRCWSSRGRVKEVRLPLVLPQETLRRAEEALTGPLETLPAAPKGLEDLFAHLSRALASGFALRYREGLSEALKEPEAKDPGFLERLVALYEEGGEDLLTPPGRVDVRVGEVEGLALVQAGFQKGEWLGELTLIGPLRMRYAEALSVAFSLSQVYTGQHAD